MSARDDEDSTGHAASLAWMRHELRTPLNAILGYGQLLLEDGPAQEEAAILRRVEARARLILEAIGERLDPARGGAAAGPPDPADPPAARLRRAIEAPIRELRGDCALLVLDAEHAGRRDSLPDLRRIRDAAQRLFTTLDECSRHAGPGVADEGGHGGAPRAAPAAEAQAARVLVVDDQESNRDLLSRWLARQRHEVLLAEDGAAALALLTGHVCDLVLLDVMMPGMSGIDVLGRMKRDAVLRDVPVIVISGLDDLESIVRCIELGAEDYLPKPFDPLLLRARVGSSLEKKRLRDQELAYLRCVGQVTAAAGAVEQGRFSPDALAGIAARPDALGDLARVFCKMAAEVVAREQRLAQQVQELRIEIDDPRRARQVSEITETDYFRQLQAKARTLAGRLPRRSG